MSIPPTVSVRNLSKRYRLYEKPRDRLKQLLFAGFGRSYGSEFWALRDINFDLRPGETLGIIGRNGSGKSTLLEIVAGTLSATRGEVKTNGRVAALLELGSGFNPEFSGRENIFFTGAIMGIPQKEMKDRLDEIIGFAEIGKFIDQPVKLYSSGMYVRLAFSILKGLNPDIFLVDEALAVGDIKFCQKCFQYFEEKRKEGKSFLLVSHDMQAILRLCDGVILLDEGRVIREGKPIEVVDYYYATQVGAELITCKNPPGDKQEERLPAISRAPQEPQSHRKNLEAHEGMRFGNRKMEITGFASLDDLGREKTCFLTGDQISLEVYCRANQDVHDFTVTFQLTDRFGTVVFGQNSYMATRKRLSALRDEIIQTKIQLPCSFFEGEYLVAIGATACELEFCQEYYDYLENCLKWTVGRPLWRTFHGVTEIPTKWQITKKPPGKDNRKDEPSFAP